MAYSRVYWTVENRGSWFVWWLQEFGRGIINVLFAVKILEGRAHIIRNPLGGVVVQFLVDVSVVEVFRLNFFDVVAFVKSYKSSSYISFFMIIVELFRSELGCHNMLVSFGFERSG